VVILLLLDGSDHVVALVIAVKVAVIRFLYYLLFFMHRNIVFLTLIIVALLGMVGYQYYPILTGYKAPSATMPPVATVEPIDTGSIATSTTGMISSGSIATGTIAVGTMDGFAILRTTNPVFQEALTRSENKDYTGAIELLKEVRSGSTSPREQAIADFSISSATFALDRIAGAREYINLAKNTEYPVRTRALAMQRVYLMYKKYNDPQILRAIIEDIGIQWTTPEESTLAYIRQWYALYPLPSFAVYLMFDDVKKHPTKSEVSAIYESYKKEIDEGLFFMQWNEWESAEIVGTMLAMASMQAKIYNEYALLSRAEVEKSFKDLIQFDQDKWLMTNKQWSLLYYADFLARAGDEAAAQSVLRILLDSGLEWSLVEALPKSKSFIGIRNMTTLIEPRMIELQKSIWSNL
jgi:hypothetical protein